jgi:hypothetical protein
MSASGLPTDLYLNILWLLLTIKHIMVFSTAVQGQLECNRLDTEAAEITQDRRFSPTLLQ